MKVSIKFMLGVLLLTSVCLMVSGLASADTHTSQASGNAADAGTWDNGIPAPGDNLVFTGAYNVAMNQAVTYGTITLGAGYSGTTTQGAVDFGYSEFSQAAGTWTGAGGARTQTCSGNWSKTGGTLSDNTINLVMTGTGKTLASNSNQAFLSLRVSGNVTMDRTAGTDWNVYALTVDSGRTFSVAAGDNIYFKRSVDNGVYSNLGTIAGPGTFVFELGDSPYNPTLGSVTAPLVIQIRSTGASQTYTLQEGLSLGSSLTIKSNHASNTCTVNTAGYGVVCSDLILGARGGLVCTGTEVITNSGNWDSSGSGATWTPTSSTLVMTGNYKSLKLGAGQTLYDLQLTAGNYLNVTGAANVTHRLRYVGAAASNHFHFNYGSTLIGNYTSNASGQIDIGAMVLGVQNLYHVDSYPVISTLSPTATVQEDHAYSYDFNCDQSGTWTLTTTHTFLSINAGTGVVSGTPTNAHVAVKSVVVTLTNPNGTDSVTYTLTVTNQAPTFTSTAITTGEMGQDYTYDANCTDDGAGTVTYSISSTDNVLTVNSTTGVITGHIIHMSLIYANVTANDGHGGVTVQSFVITPTIPDYANTLAPILLGICTVFIPVAVVMYALEGLRRKGG